MFKTPKEKAKEMLQKFTDELFDDGHRISKPMMKMCALICVNEILATTYMDVNKYWQLVNQEIENS